MLDSFGVQGDGPSQFALLHNIGVDKNGRVYVCDRENNRIQIFDDQGNYLDQSQIPHLDKRKTSLEPGLR